MKDSNFSPKDEPRTSSPMALARGFFILAGCGVALGAFGAHALKDLRSASQLDIWKTATFYLLVHAVAGAALALVAHHSMVRRKDAKSDELEASRSITPTPHTLEIPILALQLLFAGCVVFAGSLYALVLTQKSLLGAVTPFGGLMFIAGWLILALRVRVLKT